MWGRPLPAKGSARGRGGPACRCSWGQGGADGGVVMGAEAAPHHCLRREPGRRQQRMGRPVRATGKGTGERRGWPTHMQLGLLGEWGGSWVGVCVLEARCCCPAASPTPCSSHARDPGRVRPPPPQSPCPTQARPGGLTAARSRWGLVTGCPWQVQCQGVLNQRWVRQGLQP